VGDGARKLLVQASASNNTDVCPISTSMASHVVLNKRNPAGPLLVPMQSDASTAKYATYFSATNTTKVLKAMQWTSSSPGSHPSGSAAAFAGPLAILGFPFEDRRRDVAVNGSEAGATTSNVGAALLHSGVSAVGDISAHVAAQTVLAHPLSPDGYLYGYAVAIVELTADAVYHVAVAAAAVVALAVVLHMYRVEPGGGGVGWGALVVTQLSNITAPWGWGTSDVALAARHATEPGGLPAALVVGTSRDSRCGVTAGWPATCVASGGAHVYTLVAGVWVWQGALKAPVVKNNAFCGTSVAIAGAVVVGCPSDKSPSTLVDHGEGWTNGSDVGSAHVWRLDAANASKSVREGYLKAFRALSGQRFGTSVAAAANATREVVVVGAPWSSTGAPYGNVTSSFAMRYDEPVAGSVLASEGEVWTFMRKVSGGGGVGTWEAAHRVKAPGGMENEMFGWTLSAATTAAGDVMVGVGTRGGCGGYLVALQTAPQWTPRPRLWPGSASQVMSSIPSPGTCPAGTGITSHVALDGADARRPVLVTMRATTSNTKYATYYNATNATQILKATQWTSSTNGPTAYASAAAYVAPLAVIGFGDEERQRSLAVNGSEAGTVTNDVGAALLHSGVEVGGDGGVRVAAQTVLAHPTSPVGYRYGWSVGIVELDEDTRYHVAIATSHTSGTGVVHMYSVTAGGGGGGWGLPPNIALLSTLTAPWNWGSEIFSLAGRGATGGRAAALVVGTPVDNRCGVTAASTNACYNTGAAHVYTVDPSGAWAWNGTLKPSALKGQTLCGMSVAVAGDVVAVGCNSDNSPSTAVDVGEDWTNATPSVGAAHAWRLSATNASTSVREGYLKAATAAAGQSFGTSVAVAVNTTHEVVAVGAPYAKTGAPYGDMSAFLAMPYNVSVTGVGKQTAEGEVWTFVHAVGGGAGTWRGAHRVKPPVGLAYEGFGWALTAAATPEGQVVLGVGTVAGCKGYVVVLP